MHRMRVGDSDRLSDLIKDHLKGKQNLIGIQIGSYAGESAQLFVKSGVFKILYCIDHQEMNYDIHDYASDKSLVQAEQLFNQKFKDNEIVKKIKDKSSNVFNIFDDNSIDFIYIDGCHLYEAVKEDLINYYPKIKKDGIVAGHDWHNNWPGVKKAVFEYFQKEPLKIYGDGGSWVYIKE